MKLIIVILMLSVMASSAYAEFVGKRYPRTKEDEALITDDIKKRYCGDPPDKECVDNMYTWTQVEEGVWEAPGWGRNVCGQPANPICEKNQSRIDAKINEDRKLNYRVEHSLKIKLNEAVLKKLSKDDADFVGCSEWGFYDIYLQSSVKTKLSLMDQGKCWKINEGQKVTLKECDPKYEICKFSPGLFKFGFWTWIYNAEPKN